MYVDSLEMSKFLNKQQDDVVGKRCVSFISDFGRSLVHSPEDRVKPYTGVFRLNNGYGYITAKDYQTAWYSYPYWFKCIWKLSTSNCYTHEQLANMTVYEVYRADVNSKFKLKATYTKPIVEEKLAFKLYLI